MFKRIESKVKVLRADPHMREAAKGTLLAFVLKICGSGLTFLFNVAVARLLGAEGAGIFFLALTVTTIATVIGRLGLDNALLKFIASAATEEKWGQVKGYFSTGIKMALVASGAITLILFVTASWISTELFKKPELAEPLRWMSLSILPFAILNLQAESLKGLKQIRNAMTVQGVGVPLISLLLIYPLYQISGVVGVVASYAIATTAVMLLGAWAWQHEMAKHNVAGGLIRVDELWESCRSLLTVSLMNRAILPWAPLFILGAFASIEDVGIYGAASRVAMLVTFVLVTVNNVVAPKFAELYTKGDMVTLGRTARHSALIITVLASPIFIMLILSGGWVMSLFGAEFEQGGVVLAILAVGQLVNVITGSVGYLLMMSGNNSTVQTLSIYSTLLLLVASAIAIPLWGSIGAAIATSLAVAANNLGASWLVYRKFGIKTIAFI